MVVGDGGCEACTAIAWGATLSLEIPDVRFRRRQYVRSHARIYAGARSNVRPYRDARAQNLVARRAMRLPEYSRIASTQDAFKSLHRRRGV